MLPLNKNIKLILNYVVGPLVFCLLIYSIYRQVQRQSNWEQSLKQIRQALDEAGIWKLIAAIILMVLNWGIEARKWQIAISRLQKISIWQSFKAILSGTTLAFFTPNRMGEYMGRVLYVEEGKRIQAISLTIVCSMGQLLVTLIFGIVGLVSIRAPIIQSQPAAASVVFWINAVMYAAILGAFFLTLIYFRLSWLVRWVEKIPRIEKYLTYIRVLDGFHATILWRILSLSVARYLVFVLQYYLLFQVFKVGLDWWQVFWSVSVVFLVLAIIPTIALLTELGVRWKASIELVQIYSNNVVGILATSLAIWIINLVIPALVGSLLILGIRIFTNKNNNQKIS